MQTQHKLPFSQVMCRSFGVNLGQPAWSAIIILPIIFLSWIRNLDDLTVFSTIANLCILFGLGVIVYEEFYQLLVQDPYDPNEMAAIRRPDGDIQYFAYKTLPLYFGFVVLSFEGIGMVRIKRYCSP